MSIRIDVLGKFIPGSAQYVEEPKQELVNLAHSAIGILTGYNIQVKNGCAQIPPELFFLTLSTSEKIILTLFATTPLAVQIVSTQENPNTGVLELALYTIRNY